MSFCVFDDIDEIGKLKNLEILRIKNCQITELHLTMNELTRLKVLEVSNCSREVIPPNIISNMTELEELDLWSNFERWGETVQYKNESLRMRDS